MITLNESANTVEELRQKVALALGVQMNLPLSEDTNQSEMSLDSEAPSTPVGESVGRNTAEAPFSAAPLAGLANANQTRTRGTKAQIEADRQAKNAKATSPKEKIENNFAAADEAALVEPEESSALVDDAPDLIGEEEPAPQTGAVQHDVKSCQNILRDIIGPTQAGMPEAEALMKKFKLDKVPSIALLPNAKKVFNDFYAEAFKVLKGMK